MGAFSGSTKLKIFIGGTKVKKAYLGSTKIYSSGNIVTYNVNGTTYQEEVDEGASVLNPTTFTPTLSGWTFAGWRSDTTASSSVLSGTVMGDSPMTLYAVFRQTITVTYYNGSTSANTTSGYRYYNTGNVANPSFKLTQTAKSGWTARGWSTGTAGNSGITYNNATSFTKDSNITLYGMYYQTITLSYNGNGSTSGSVSSQTGTRYWNSGKNAYTNPSFTLSANGYAKTNYTFSKWAMGSASGTQYSAGASVTLSASTTFYATWTLVTTGVLYQNGALTSLGNLFVTSITASKTHKPGEYVETPTSTSYNALVLNRSLNLKITWSVAIHTYPQQGDTFYAKVNGTQVYYFNDGTMNSDGEWITDRTGSGTASVSNISTVPVIIGCSNNVSIEFSYITFTITKVESV